MPAAQPNRNCPHFRAPCSGKARFLPPGALAQCLGSRWFLQIAVVCCHSGCVSWSCLLSPAPISEQLPSDPSSMQHAVLFHLSLGLEFRYRHVHPAISWRLPLPPAAQHGTREFFQTYPGKALAGNTAKLEALHKTIVSCMKLHKYLLAFSWAPKMAWKHQKHWKTDSGVIFSQVRLGDIWILRHT